MPLTPGRQSSTLLFAYAADLGEYPVRASGITGIMRATASPRTLLSSLVASIDTHSAPRTPTTLLLPARRETPPVGPQVTHQ